MKECVYVFIIYSIRLFRLANNTNKRHTLRKVEIYKFNWVNQGNTGEEWGLLKEEQNLPCELWMLLLKMMCVLVKSCYNRIVSFPRLNTGQFFLVSNQKYIYIYLTVILSARKNHTFFLIPAQHTTTQSFPFVKLFLFALVNEHGYKNEW